MKGNEIGGIEAVENKGMHCIYFDRNLAYHAL